MRKTLRPILSTGLAVVAMSCFLSGCAKGPGQNQNDPFEGYNRAVFSFNQDAYAFFHPVLEGYRKVIPSPVRDGVTNVFDNLEMIPAIGNDLLQFNFKWAFEDLGRFLLNSTLGCLGLFDVAKHVGLYQRNQSFGLTLARWGVTKSPFIMLPLLGPTTLRGIVGMAPDYYLSPVSYVSGSNGYYKIEAVQYLNTASIYIPRSKLITQNAIDPYIALRNAYLQNQKMLIWQVRHENLPISDDPALKQALPAIPRPSIPGGIPGEKKN